MTLQRPHAWLIVVALGGCGADGSTSAGESSTGASGSSGAGSSSEPTGSTGSTGLSDASTEGVGGSTTGPSTTDAPTGESSGAPSPDLGGIEGSRCEQTATTIVCPKLTVELGPWQRDVHYQVPLGRPPVAGWPVVLMFQGSFFSAEVTWLATDDLPFGAYYQTLAVKRLLDHGYAVITPEAKLAGGTFWDTNVPPYSINWESSEDHALMLELFAQIEAGSFGEIDAARMFATGVSSGGYMSSRVALAYPGRFRAIAVAAASYMTCSGPICAVPKLAADHPPTVLMHGEVDLTVPLWTAEDYHAALLAAGVDSKLVTDPDEGHGWIPAAPDEVLAWFDAYL